MISRNIGVEAYPVWSKKYKILTNLISSDTIPYALRIKSKVAIRGRIAKKLGNTACDFITGHIHHYSLFNVRVCNTRKEDDINASRIESYKAIINLKETNDYKRINKFFEAVNKKLPIDGLFINRVEIYEARKKRILQKFPKPFSHIYNILDYFFHRVCPKLKLISKLYFNITGGYNRALTKTELLGRLYSCGFTIVDEKTINNHLYFVAKKTQKPSYDMNPTYGPLISLKRIGKHGKQINVYKFRTMHPYSEYLQQYIFEKNNLRKGGKLKGDFRISHLGKILRKYWIDELPMIINCFLGDMKIIGVRPLSSQYFNLYTKELQEKRTKVKPGLIPPFYADMPETLDEIMESELRYLNEYEKSPFLTDIKYTYKIFKNIIVKGKRSL